MRIHSTDGLDSSIGEEVMVDWEVRFSPDLDLGLYKLVQGWNDRSCYRVFKRDNTILATTSLHSFKYIGYRSLRSVLNAVTESLHTGLW
jgi:hypothetical protein